MRAHLLTASFAFFAAARFAAAAEPPGAVDYGRQVKPILADRCFACHGTLKQKAGLRLDASPLIRKGGDNGPAIVPGKADDSLLIHAVTGTHDAERMPKEGAPLTDEQIGLLRAWVEQGAKAPDEPTPPDPRDHWAFKPPVRPAVPDVKDRAWVRNPIDAFVAAGHERQGLAHRPEAGKATLLRRAYVDLIGLPPTRQQLHAFLADESADAYEKVVDELLASPRYGERWGRHWMDVWRYSDWAGYQAEVRDSQPFVWRWRDWIVESLNADKGYDRMVAEMLAGDELAPADPQTVRATGYLARSWYKFNRNVWLENTVEHTSKAFLGLTLNCAKCHDHKYDPVSQRDYYRFRAFFEPTNVRTDRVPGEPDTKKDGLARIFDEKADAATYLFVRGDEKSPDKDHPLTPATPAVLGGGLKAEAVSLPPEAYYPALQPFVAQDLVAAARAEVDKAKEAAGKAEAEAAAAKKGAEDAMAKTSAPASRPTTGPATRPAAEPPPAAAAFLDDDFAAARPGVWTLGPGVWAYRGGRLVQSRIGDGERSLLSVAEHPRDFTARFTFRITGGEKWCSVGLGFDVADGEANNVYLSAHAGGPCASFYYRHADRPVYPPNNIAPLPVRLGQTYALRVDVRDTLVNVYADDVRVMAYRLPHARRPGRLSAWTFDASADFLHARVDPLPASAILTETVAGTVPEAAELALKQATAAAAQARARVAVAEAERAAAEVRIAADRAKYASPPAAEVQDLALAAGKAERAAVVAKAEVAALAAEQQADAARAVAKAGDEKAKKDVEQKEKALADKRKALEAARTAADKPSPTYTPLGPTYPPTSTGRRLALARWITSRDNPLAARVAVNHVWMRHFGEPLVPTVFDFGLKGKPPTDSALLDWLAVEFMDPSAGSGQAHGWSMKRLHRLIVTSAAYRMDSSAGPEDAANVKADPDNRFLWRANARRMEAEVVRDSVLAVSGRLDLTAGGPDLDAAAALSNPRRSLYFRHANEKQAVFLQTFDAASPTECYRRAETVLPQQALALANSSLALAQSRLLAGDLTKGIGAGADETTAAAFVTAAFEQVLSRPPAAAEREACVGFLAEQAKRLAGPKGLTPFGSGDAAAVKPSADPHQRARENLVHVLMNHNDFVTVR